MILILSLDNTLFIYKNLKGGIFFNYKEILHLNISRSAYFLIMILLLRCFYVVKFKSEFVINIKFQLYNQHIISFVLYRLCNVAS